jgi:hypothetical protein
VLDIGVKIFHLFNCKQSNFLGYIYNDFVQLGFVTKKSFGGKNLYRV